MIILSFRQRNVGGELRAIKFHIGKDKPVTIEYEGEEFVVPAKRIQQIAKEVTQLVERFDNSLPKTKYNRRKPR